MWRHSEEKGELLLKLPRDKPRGEMVAKIAIRVRSLLQTCNGVRLSEKENFSISADYSFISAKLFPRGNLT